MQVAFERNPLKDGFTLWNTLRVMYLAIFAAYWLYNLVHCFLDLREAAVIKHFTQHRLGLSPRQLRTVTWPEVARRIVDVSLGFYLPYLGTCLPLLMFITSGCSSSELRS